MWQKSRKHSFDGTWQHKKTRHPPFSPVHKLDGNLMEIYWSYWVNLQRLCCQEDSEYKVFSKSNKWSLAANTVVERTFKQASIHWVLKWGVIFIYLLPLWKVLGGVRLELCTILKQMRYASYLLPVCRGPFFICSLLLEQLSHLSKIWEAWSKQTSSSNAID